MVFFFSFLFFLDVLWFWGYFGNFESMLATLVISRVFLSKFPTLNIYIYIYFTHEKYQNIKNFLNTPKPIK